MKKWLFALLAIGCMAGGVACSNSGEGGSSENSSVELPNVSVQELIDKNTISKTLKDNKTLYVVSTDKGNKGVTLQQNAWYYSYENGKLQVDFRAKTSGSDISEYGTYSEGVYYGELGGSTFAHIIPEQDFNTYVYSFADLKMDEKDYEDNALLVAGDELVLKANPVEEGDFRYTWSYRFDKETHEVTKAQALVYKTNGIFVKTTEITFDRDETMEWDREAYNEVKNAPASQKTVVTAYCVKGGAVAFNKKVTLLKGKKLYATDERSGQDYCVYTDAACTQMIVELGKDAEVNTEVYMSIAKEGDIPTRDTLMAQKDNYVGEILEAYGKYYAAYTAYNYKGEKLSQQYWYYDDNRAENAMEVDGTTTMDCWMNDELGVTTKVVNYRDTAFYTWTSEGRFEFALVMDEDYESAMYAYGRKAMGTQKIEQPMMQEGNQYTLVTTRKEIDSGYKTSNWKYTFEKKGDDILLKDIHIDYCDAEGDAVAYAEVKIDYGNEYSINSDAYDKIAGKRSGTKIKLNMVLDYATKDVRTVPYSLYNKTYISIYPTELGSGYKIYRNELLTHEITALADFGNEKEKSVYVVSFPA